VTTCLENVEISGNYTDVREMSGISLKVMELSGKKSCRGKFSIIVLLWMALVFVMLSL